MEQGRDQAQPLAQAWQGDENQAGRRVDMEGGAGKGTQARLGGAWAGGEVRARAQEAGGRVRRCSEERRSEAGRVGRIGS